MERDDGCYKIDATDGSSRKLDVTMHPATGAVVHSELDDCATPFRPLPA